ncbi:MAG: hypothetical protein PHX49_02515 [Bacteroidales bacterium]|jgi:hypothetical protein|nr:hypothetical protein [Bacteroidales bacterium]
MRNFKKAALFVVSMVLGTTLLMAQVKNDRLSGTYEGAKKKELANGKGKAVGKDTYEGQFKKGLPDGIGIYTFGENLTLGGFVFAVGDTYEGAFKKGKFHGKGKITFVDKEKGVLEGYFEDGKYVGKTKDGYIWMKEESSGINRVIVQKRNSSKNDISISGIGDLTEIGAVHGTFNSSAQTWTDLRSEEFPFTIHIKGVNATNYDRCVVKLVIESPGTWEIKVVPNL